MEFAGLGSTDISSDNERKRGIVLRAIDKLDRFGSKGVRQLLGEGRKDESGDFTYGAGLMEGQKDAIDSFLNSKGANNLETLRNLHAAAGGSDVGRAGVQELHEIIELLEAQGYGPDRIVIDPSVVRGLGYYTGPVYEAELTFEIPDEMGRPRQFGSVAGGGRYDDLVKRFTGQEVPATGVSIGVDRLLAALEAKGRFDGDADGPVVVTVMDKSRLAEYQAMVGELRKSNIRAELYLGNPKNFGNQLKYCDKRGAPFAIIQGEDEAVRNVVQVKDLKLGARLADELSHEEWRDQPAQFEVARGDLVAEIKKRLG
jgi:histidyl-tRNA synthetase